MRNIQGFVFDFCPNCGVEHGFPQALYNSAINDRGNRGRSIYCPNGHGWHYTGETEAGKLRLERDRLKQRVAQKDDEIAEEQNRTAAYKGQITKLKKRAKAGVCPCCHRSVQQLARHIKSKHPNYSTEPGALNVIEGGKR